MTKYIQLLFVVILLFISGCNSSTTSSEATPTNVSSADSTVSPEVKSVPPSSSPPTELAAPTSTLSSASPSKMTPSVPQKIDSIIGEPLKDQSFQVNFENFGESEFITTKENVKGKNRPHLYFKSGESVAELKHELESPESFYTVSAVSFRDVSGDGKKDIIVIADYTTGFGYMGAIPISQLIIFKQTESGFNEDHSIEDKARSGVPYRILTVPDVMIGLKTDPKESIPNAWQRLHPGTYKLEGSGELGGSTLTIRRTSGDGLLFNLDAFYAANKEALKQGGVNVGTIDSAKATPSSGEMIFKDSNYELSFYMISSGSLCPGQWPAILWT
ncbi:hypothetical protein [Paenibacillus sp. Soil724D2]|uniref:hypothetical protein n=1 Tax=Paenibacillus sp. (strain Soil724D2) TaxID=1736392 RepID=UPI000712D670|nr:hypothetical protein [Paenibacillus sp. Soil724D2]KRE44268.1 hypothetical protein ASG85_33030 [Paenibacillus sp. Soil724D2]